MTSRWNHNTAYHSELLAAAPGPDSKVLDVGSGDGLLVSKFAEVVHDVRGIDSDPMQSNRLGPFWPPSQTQL